MEKKKLFNKIITILICLFAFNYCVNAQTTINVKKRVYGAYDLDNTFHYTVTQKDTNPEIFDNLGMDFDIVFDHNSEISSYISEYDYTLDFSNIEFDTLGRYEFVLSETSSNQSIYPTDNNTYSIIVNVLNELDENNTPTGEKIIDVMGSAYQNDTSKGDIIFETRPLTYITLSKNVTGDLANINEYFKFKIELNVDGDNTFTINGQDSSVIYNGEEISTSNQYDSSITNYVYLKHGQTITVGIDNDTMQIPSGFSYSIEEIDASNYKTYVNNSNSDRKSYLATIVNVPEKNNVSYVNNYESTVLTGLFVNIVPFILLVTLSVVAMFIVKIHGKKKHNTINN